MIIRDELASYDGVFLNSALYIGFLITRVNGSSLIKWVALRWEGVTCSLGGRSYVFYRICHFHRVLASVWIYGYISFQRDLVAYRKLHSVNIAHLFFSILSAVGFCFSARVAFFLFK